MQLSLKAKTNEINKLNEMMNNLYEENEKLKISKLELSNIKSDDDKRD